MESNNLILKFKIFLKKLLLGLFIILLTIAISSVSFNFIHWLFDKIINIDNQYIYETLYYFFPLMLTSLLSMPFFLKKKNGIGITIVVGGVLYAVYIWFAILWMSGESCLPILYGLITTCN